jgi:hypothetical protein
VVAPGLSAPFGYTSRDRPGLFAFIYLVNFFVFIGFAFLGLLTAWRLAFRPEEFKRLIERFIAKRNPNRATGRPSHE